jgi:hypothetical protein
LRIILEGVQRPILNFAPKGKLWPQGRCCPRGEFCPLGVKFSVHHSSKQ